jgi:hypothetical protein
MIRYGTRTPILDPYGLPHPDEATAFLKQSPEIEPGAAEELSRRMIKPLARFARERPLQVRRTDTAGAFGVMHRAVKTDAGALVLLVNVLSRPVSVRLINKDGTLPRGQDILNGEAVDGTQIELPVRCVRLIRVD